ncbi:MAG: hypothetical protein K6G61_13095 [Solobacterium sp.]|nr:hypothetical protein [Solobacterium sp.]
MYLRNTASAILIFAVLTAGCTGTVQQESLQEKTAGPEQTAGSGQTGYTAVTEYPYYYHTLPEDAGYTSGRIVIGDSRCCQLGVYAEETGRADFAVFAVWGGHYSEGAMPAIMTDELVSEAEECFQAQIRACGECALYLFATINDCDFSGNDNETAVAAAAGAAETFASMRFEYEGREYHPDVFVIGFDGVRHSASASEIDRIVEEYNEQLRIAVKNSELLKENASQYTTVPEITDNRTEFIEDGLHYSDSTLKMIADHIADSGNR